MRKFMVLAAAVSVVSAIGCSGSDAPADTTVATSSNAASTPDGAVAKFLEAVRTGNSAVASASLTPLSLTQIKENEMDFTPPASETAQFRVGKVEMFERDKAFVESVWIELDADGKPFEETMTWGLKLIDGQWRISGMAAHLGPNQPPVVFDFENPDQFIGVQNTVSDSPQGDSPRQAKQKTEDPFGQTISR
ncbi:MAG: hypothetical protein GXP26_02835 [Planctomycetes bacterium]|nr:hypothetical protein [Planctomycetota bacterium]